MKNIHNILFGSGFDLVKIKYRFKGMVLRRKGFDIVSSKNGYIHYSFEPIDRDGNKWLIKDHVSNIIRYRTSLSAKNLSFIDLSNHLETGFITGRQNKIEDLSITQ